MTEIEDRLDAIETRLARLEARDGEMPRGIETLIRQLFPDDVRTHMRAARREQLLAARAFLDHWIERMDRSPADEPVTRRESIPLE